MWMRHPPTGLGPVETTERSYRKVWQARGWEPCDPPVSAKAVPDGTVDEVLAWVDGHAGRATAALQVEQSRPKPRTSLTSALAEVTEPATDEKE